MPEVWFYHLQRQPLEHVLPILLEKSLERNWRVTVQATSEERLEALDQWLWTYAEASFLAHGRAGDGDTAMQPVFLTTCEDNPNQASVRLFIDGASAASLLEGETAKDYTRVILLFDGNNEEELTYARSEWKRLKAAGFDLSYWQQSAKGGWEKQKI
jgi:DNA polymerase-3 subunit chi